MRRAADQCPADIFFAPSGSPLTVLEYADDVVIFAESSTKHQHAVNLVSKLAAAYGLRLRPDKYKQMLISSRPRTGIRVDEQPIELVNEFCYLSWVREKLDCTLDCTERKLLRRLLATFGPGYATMKIFTQKLMWYTCG
ncbi:hypothetical protein RB195_007693 [Necator americanus]|uniref:Reverse transcriptase domain-containing protein n=1 Tax=Necator americanus TaxID=51031 RepID=A0ABR1C1V9_NECAM